MPGTVYIIGAGPGDPDLITLKALKVIKEADTILYDRLVSPEILKHAKPDAELIYVGKAPGNHEFTQEEINKLLYAKALTARTVARLHGGDPLFYGRGEEECLYLITRGIRCKIIPGVPSPFGAAAEYLIPLAGRDIASNIIFSTGTFKGGKKISVNEARNIIQASHHTVFLMATSSYKNIIEASIIAKGPDTAVAVVEKATTPKSRLVIGKAQELLGSEWIPSPPAIIFVGGGPRWRLEKINAQYY